jgi:hypothetical protein
LYFESVGAARPRDLIKLFGWPSQLAGRTLSRLVQDGALAEGVTRKDVGGEWLALTRLVRE